MSVKHLPLILLCLSLAACAQWLPASVQTLADNHYQASAFGNSFANTESLAKKVDHRAKAFCAKHDQSLHWLAPLKRQWRQQDVYIDGVARRERFMQVSREFNCADDGPAG